jgi:hypothetical protein
MSCRENHGRESRRDPKPNYCTGEDQQQFMQQSDSLWWNKRRAYTERPTDSLVEEEAQLSILKKKKLRRL